MKILAIWQGRWEDLVTTTKMGEITSVTFRPSTYVHVQERRSKTALARLRTSQGYLMSRETQPFCDDCLVPLTVRHFGGVSLSGVATEAISLPLSW